MAVETASDMNAAAIMFAMLNFIMQRYRKLVSNFHPIMVKNEETWNKPSKKPNKFADFVKKL